MRASEMDWMFDVLFELSEHADSNGFAHLSRALEQSMDAYCLDESLSRTPTPVFHSQRRVDPDAIGWGVAGRLKLEPMPRRMPQIKEPATA